MRISMRRKRRTGKENGRRLSKVLKEIDKGETMEGRNMRKEG